MRIWKKESDLAIQIGQIIANHVHWGHCAIMNDWRNRRPGYINCWHSRRLLTKILQQRRHTYQDREENGYYNQGYQPILIQGLHLYIFAKKMHVFRSKEWYIRPYRGITTLLDKTLKKTIRNGLQIWLMCYEIFFNRTQGTILWHVDELKMLHVDSEIVSSVLAGIDAEYGNIVKMTITRGKIHRYLGMTINYYSPVKVIFSIVDYIGNIPDWHPIIHKWGMINTSCTPYFSYFRRCI